MNPRRRRLTEALLLFCTALVLLLGTLLVSVAKMPSNVPVLVNSAPASELTKALGGDAALAQRVVADRTKNGAFTDVDALVRHKLLTPSQLKAVELELAVRTWGTASATLWLCTVGLLVMFLGLHLHIRRIWPLADPYLLPCAALLSVLGVLLLFGLKDPVRDRMAFFAQAQGVWLGGIGVFLLTIRRFWSLPLHRYGYLYVLSSLLLIVLLAIFGRGLGGVKLNLFGFQPVELIKVLLAFFLASYLADRGRALADTSAQARRADLYPLLAMYALPLALFALLKDLGPVLVLFGTFVALLYVVTSRGAFVWLGLVALGLGGWIGYVLEFGVFRTRVEMWLHPWENAAPGGDQLALGLWGMATGGATGAGLGRGGTGFIPRGGSDLAFSALAEDVGVLGPLVVLLCLGVIFWRGLALVPRTRSEFERYLAAGLTTLIGLQGLVIICGCLGLLPLTGISLPLVAYGKSAVVMTWVSIGLLLGISQRAQHDPELVPPYVHKGLSRLTLALTVPLLVCVVTAFAAQTVLANTRALQLIKTPDADKAIRAHRNPRLLAIANQIPRGSLLDRKGKPLAKTVEGKRVYPLGPAGAHLIGVLSPALGGPTGFEESLAAPLQGMSDWGQALALWRAKDAPGFTLPQGKDVKLTLDADLQEATLKAIVRAAGRVKDKKTGKPKRAGAAVVIDIATGGVLAAVTAPTYDPSQPVTETDGSPQVNRATSGLYPPGSAFKPVTAAALLKAGKGNLKLSGGTGGRETVRWKAGGKSYSRSITNDDGEALGGSLSLTEALVHSSNIYFAHAGLEVGAEALQEMSGQFGLTHLPVADRWTSELPDLAYGQGSLLVTPLELAGTMQTIAAGGTRRKLHFVESDKPETLATPITPEQAAVIARALAGVTERGTARGVFSSVPFSVAGKTGTAQTGNGDKQSHSWFVGFAPARAPKIAFAVIIENGGYGAKSAAPAAREILKAWGK
ncbi:penicillin-binding transpeptidase domain-containing protein [Armatimonas rosea]|uniref:Cell division protein FtsI/penicillin-binding protein 2/cell division protein FtsW (Lipid II flippase) n=1 Tax=Armatimonas rosea TaxID=685828 RepID=A0A7W9W953_ARMRO|nr:penicillin-binding transpeptidase domain-containing protein [Armatimonas rosea]MBB6052277.1 cell division protein FtsI/penicillin-binding protein 2/cell division protein FtsW (lipid II flippase) [Armatimonas rosea]